MFLNSQRDCVTISATDNADLRRRRVEQPLPALVCAAPRRLPTPSNRLLPTCVDIATSWSETGPPTLAMDRL